jgi:hypothetical protein
LECVFVAGDSRRVGTSNGRCTLLFIEGKRLKNADYLSGLLGINFGLDATTSTVPSSTMPATTMTARRSAAATEWIAVLVAARLSKSRGRDQGESQCRENCYSTC